MKALYDLTPAPPLTLARNQNPLPTRICLVIARRSGPKVLPGWMSALILDAWGAAQLVAALAWVAVICHDSRQQDVVAAADGGRQLQSSWRAMERLELWCVP